MFKRTAVVGTGLMILLGLLFGRSHLVTTVGMVKQTVKDSVPVEFEIKRARQMIKDLTPEIEKNIRLIAQEEVEVAKLEDKVEHASEKLAQDRRDIFQLKGDLDSGSEIFRYAGRSYSASQVRADLISRFDQFRTQEATLDNLHQVLQARQQSLQAARDKLDGMLDAKRELEVQVENVEAQRNMIDVAKTTSSFQFDDSHLNKTRELIDEIATRLEVEAKLVHADVQYFERIPLNEPEEFSDRDITHEISEYFSTEAVPAAEALTETSL